MRTHNIVLFLFHPRRGLGPVNGRLAPAEAEAGMTLVVFDDGDANAVGNDSVKEMIWKSIEVDSANIRFH